jgi:hypothetical protein
MFHYIPNLTVIIYVEFEAAALMELSIMLPAKRKSMYT